MYTGYLCSWCRVSSAQLMINFPTALYVISNVYICCPQDVPAKTLRILALLYTLSAMIERCLGRLLIHMGIGPAVVVGPL